MAVVVLRYPDECGRSSNGKLDEVPFAAATLETYICE